MIICSKLVTLICRRKRNAKKFEHQKLIIDLITTSIKQQKDKTSNQIQYSHLYMKTSEFLAIRFIQQQQRSRNPPIPSRSDSPTLTGEATVRNFGRDGSAAASIFITFAAPTEGAGAAVLRGASRQLELPGRLRFTGIFIELNGLWDRVLILSVCA